MPYREADPPPDFDPDAETDDLGVLCGECGVRDVADAPGWCLVYFLSTGRVSVVCPKCREQYPWVRNTA